MARKKIRKVHIEDQIWVYVIKPNYYGMPYANIYSLKKELYQVYVELILGEPVQDMTAFYSDSYKPDLKISPGKVKAYILKEILKRDENIRVD